MAVCTTRECTSRDLDLDLDLRMHSDRSKRRVRGRHFHTFRTFDAGNLSACTSGPRGGRGNDGQSLRNLRILATLGWTCCDFWHLNTELRGNLEITHRKCTSEMGVCRKPKGGTSLDLAHHSDVHFGERVASRSPSKCENFRRIFGIFGHHGRKPLGFRISPIFRTFANHVVSPCLFRKQQIFAISAGGCTLRNVTFATLAGNLRVSPLTIGISRDFAHFRRNFGHFRSFSTDSCVFTGFATAANATNFRTFCCVTAHPVHPRFQPARPCASTRPTKIHRAGPAVRQVACSAPDLSLTQQSCVSRSVRERVEPVPGRHPSSGLPRSASDLRPVTHILRATCIIHPPSVV